MAETVHLFLKANGNDVAGESSQVSVGRDGSIECVYFEHGVASAREAGSGMAVGRRQYRPIRIRKRIDRSSPLLMQALCRNESIEGEFYFYRPAPSGDGQTEQFYTITIERGYIESIHQVSDNALQPALSTTPPMEDVTFVFRAIKWTHKAAGTEAEDSWDRNQ